MVWGKGKEALKNVEASKNWAKVGILKEFPNIDFKLRPGSIIFANESPSDLSNRVSNVLLHWQVLLVVDSNKQILFDCWVELGGEVVPKIAVGGWAEIGEAKAELWGWEVSALDGSLA